MIPTKGEHSLIVATRTAIAATLQALNERHPAETLAGYAIITDDSVTTVGYLGITSEVLASRDAGLRFEAVDWPYDDGMSAFDTVRQILVEHSKDHPPHLHVEPMFTSLVSALSAARRDHNLGDDVFLSVLSSDPSPQLLQLEDMAVKALNPTPVYAAWKAAISPV